MHYLLPLHYTEFITWYRQGFTNLLAFRLIQVPLDSGGRLLIDEDTTTRIVDALPDYEDDWEALLTLVELDDVALLVPSLNGYCTPRQVRCHATDIKAVYPVSRRGRRMLANRLDDQIQLGEPFCEEEVAAREEEHHRALALQGGYALLEYFNLDQYREEFKAFEDEVWQAVRNRHREEPYPVDGGSFADNLLCYDRRNPKYPQTPIGFAYDFGKIVQEYWKESRPVLDVLAQFWQEGLQKNASDELWDNLDYLRPHLEALQEETECRYPAISCIAFLQVQEILRSGSSLENIDGLYNQLMAIGAERELALALWLAGAFFDFTPFATEYYERIEAPFLQAAPEVAASEPVAAQVEIAENGRAAGSGSNQGGSNSSLSKTARAGKGAVDVITGAGDDESEGNKKVGNENISRGEESELGLFDDSSPPVSGSGHSQGSPQDKAVNELTEIRNVGVKTAKKLLKHFDSVVKIRQLSEDELADKIRSNAARSVYEHYNNN